MTKQEEGKLRLKFTRWPPSWIWAFQVSEPPQLLRVSLTIVYTCQDHVLESLILESKYSKMTPKFVKQKSHWLHSSIKFANRGTLIFNVCVNNQGFWQFRFHRVHFNPDSQNGFSVHHNSRTPKMVDHGIAKISLPPLCKAVWGSCCSMLFTELEKIHVPTAKIVHKEDWLTPSAPIGIQELFQKYNCKYDLRKKNVLSSPKLPQTF